MEKTVLLLVSVCMCVQAHMQQAYQDTQSLADHLRSSPIAAGHPIKVSLTSNNSLQHHAEESVNDLKLFPPPWTSAVTPKGRLPLAPLPALPQPKKI